VERHKARLVAQDFHQQAGIDYHKAFSPVVKLAIICLILSFAISHKCPIRQLDVKNSFLHGHLTEFVYMKQLPGFVPPDHPHHDYKLKKAIYGLKQAPHAGFHCFSSFLRSHGFTCSTANPSMFVCCTGDHTLILLLYVDDIILIGSSSQMVTSFISLLSCPFAMKDLGDLYYFLGIQVVSTPSGPFLTQQKYVHDLLHKFHLHTS